MAESSTMSRVKAKLIKAMECGAQPDDVLDFGHRTMTFAEACDSVGMKPMRPTHEAPIEEMMKSISGFFNPQKQNFTIGGTRAKIKVLKDFKNGTYKGAKPHHVKQVLMMIDRLDPSGQQTQHPMDHASHAEPGNPQDVHVTIGKEQAMAETTTYDDLKRIVNLVHYR
jgi:hypothetical protein